uniref:Bifunctional IPC transferase and DIPP synthase n=1 Tax=Ignisphaera aggregans TaxID=334771 RepID=A0A7C4FHE1_9CREN
MIAIVLAAGYGTRLRPYTIEKPKTLIELEPGVTIFDYIVAVLKEVGVTGIYVATRREFESFFSGRNDVRVLVVDVAEDDGNLWTLYQALSALKEQGVEDDILLTMSDHIYEVNIVKKLVKVATGSSSKLYLCLDRLIRGRDAVEGLKIVVDGHSVVLSGKDIPPYSGIDTGVFFISKDLYSYIEMVVNKKSRKASLADLVNTLAKVGVVGYVDVSGLLWQDVDTVEDIERARKLYWRILARNLVKETDGIVSRYINRRISTLVSIALYKSRIFMNPNIVTLAVFAIGMLASVLIFMGYEAYGALLAVLSSILDGVDGELARLYRAQTRFGALLDTTLDRVVDVMLLTAMFHQLLVVNASFQQTLLHTVVFALAISGSIYVSYVSNALEDREYLAKLRNSFPWATRDVRILVATIATLLKAYTLAFIYIAIATWFFTIRALLHSLGKGGLAEAKFFVRPKPLSITPRPARAYTVLLEEIITYAIPLIILLYLVDIALGKTSYYAKVELSSIYALVWQAIATVEIALIVYLAYNVLKRLAELFKVLKDSVIERIWVTPSVYAKLVKRALLLIAIILSAYPLNYAMSLGNVEEELRDLGNYMVTAVALIVLFFLIIDVAKAFEHLIQKYIAKKHVKV